MEYRINGKRYNVEKAKFLQKFGDSNGVFYGELFQKRTGEFFIFGHCYDPAHDFFDHCTTVGTGLFWGIIPELSEAQMRKFCGVGLDYWK